MNSTDPVELLKNLVQILDTVTAQEIAKLTGDRVHEVEPILEAARKFVRDSV